MPPQAPAHLSTAARHPMHSERECEAKAKQGPAGTLLVSAAGMQCVPSESRARFLSGGLSADEIGVERARVATAYGCALILPVTTNNL